MTTPSSPGAGRDVTDESKALSREEGRPPLHRTYSPDFILREFRRYQDGGCTDQTFRDNAPFHVESLLAVLAELQQDARRMDWLEKRGVESVYFVSGEQLNPASMSLRAAIDAASSPTPDTPERPA